MLKEMLSDNNIELNVEVEDWKEAIKRAGELLVNEGSITEKYIENMINAVYDLGPYMVIMPGVALAHARPDGSVIKECMSLITLKNPINFGNEENDPVKLVIAFGSVENEGHIKVIGELANFLSSESNIELLNNATEKNDVIKKISEY